MQVWQGPRQWQMRNASVVTVDGARDLALLRFDRPPALALALAEPATIRVRLSIVFIGPSTGGPVFDADTGEVVGLINMVMVKGTRESALSNATGLTCSVPVRLVRELLERR